MTANVREDIDFDEVEGDLLSFQQDALVQEALSKGVDLVRSSVLILMMDEFSSFKEFLSRETFVSARFKRTLAFTHTNRRGVTPVRCRQNWSKQKPIAYQIISMKVTT